MNDISHPVPPAAKDPRDASRPKVPPFARYRGTSAWRKDRKRVHAYALYLASVNKTEQDARTSGA
jgi:hypothetical protein